MRECGIKDNLDRRMNKLQRIIWNEWCDPVWKCRCDILYKGKNEYDAVKAARLAAEIIWYIDNKDSILSYNDRFLAEIDISKLQRMTTKTKKRWLYHLDIAKEAHRRECAALADGQRTLDRYFAPREVPDEDVPT